ncbi:IclR family transcriptional regulator [Neobacillus drentensis]|uniref:IclR family transcriptional regulator n=1 Tax=Neobacillus drentensis TaxID=220684 RepID=UPI001F1B1D31|nr:IclR family transcriptional regulator [Neobacillus drentensis]ULT54923.1 IclR family transcriptional regulator [Neobacillus drentensis]
MIQEQDKLLSSVKSAIKILRAFKMDQPQKGVRELANELGLGKSSVQRILTTLASEGLVQKNKETNKYELGLSVVELSSIVLGNIDLHRESRPILTDLANKYGETAHLAILDGNHVVYLDKVESKTSNKLPSHLGFHNYAHCTSSGKLLLAHSGNYLVDLVIQNGLDAITPKTIVDPNKFRQELSTILRQGYSVSIDEYTIGRTSVSAPVRDHTGKVTAAINLVGPSPRFSRQRIQYFASELIRAGELISERLGYWKR